MFPVEIEEARARRLATIEHRGPYIEIGSAFEQGSAILGARNLWGDVAAMVGVYLGDPSSERPEDLRSYAGFEMREGAAIPEGMHEYDLLAGPVARLRFKGPYAGLSTGYDYLYCEWLPSSGRDPGDAPAYEVYVNSPSDTAPNELLTDIHLPLMP